MKFFLKLYQKNALRRRSTCPGECRITLGIIAETKIKNKNIVAGDEMVVNEIRDKKIVELIKLEKKLIK